MANSFTARAENNVSESHHHVQMGWFLNTERTAIHSDAHTTALIGDLQLAQGHPEGIVGALGRINCTIWICQNLAAVFRDDWPLSMLSPLFEQVFQRHFSQPQSLACSLFDRDHSNNLTGAGHEDVPQWVGLWNGLLVWYRSPLISLVSRHQRC